MENSKNNDDLKSTDTQLSISENLKNYALNHPFIVLWNVYYPRSRIPRLPINNLKFFRQ